MKMTVAICLLLTTTAWAREYECKIQESTGHVFLVRDFSVSNRAVRFQAWLGRETFAKPYAVRRTCESLRKYLKVNPSVPQSSEWVYRGCEDGAMIQMMSIFVHLNGQHLEFLPATVDGVRELVVRKVFDVNHCNGH